MVFNKTDMMAEKMQMIDDDLEKYGSFVFVSALKALALKAVGEVAVRLRKDTIITTVPVPLGDGRMLALLKSKGTVLVTCISNREVLSKSKDKKTNLSSN